MKKIFRHFSDLKTKQKVKRIVALCLVLFAVISWIVCANNSYIAEYVYARHLFVYLATLFTFITSIFPISFMEWGIALSPLILIILIVILVLSLKKGYKLNKRKGLLKNLLEDFYVFVIIAAVFLNMYVLFCGVNYNRYDLAKNLSYDTSVTYTTDDLKELCTYLATKANEAKENVTNDENNLMYFDCTFDELAKSGMENMLALSESYDCFKYIPCKPKSMFFSKIMSYAGFTGMYCCFTLEANINTDVCEFVIPYTICHELAHTSGYIDEDEANFVSFLACIYSDNPYYVYSGYVEALVYCHNELANQSKSAAYEVSDIMSAAVWADLLDQIEYNEEIEESETAKKVEEAATAANDSYLKSTGQEAGVASYDLVVELLLMWYYQTVN